MTEMCDNEEQTLKSFSFRTVIEVFEIFEIMIS